MTQNDLNIYVRILPEIAKVIGNENEENMILDKYGITRVRLNYLRGKIMYCNDNFENNEEMLSSILPELRPSSDEFALVRGNRAAIDEANRRYSQLRQ